jgi:hypothetical protein
MSITRRDFFLLHRRCVRNVCRRRGGEERGCTRHACRFGCLLAVFAETADGAEVQARSGAEESTSRKSWTRAPRADVT